MNPSNHLREASDALLRADEHDCIDIWYRSLIGNAAREVELAGYPSMSDAVRELTSGGDLRRMRDSLATLIARDVLITKST